MSSKLKYLLAVAVFMVSPAIAGEMAGPVLGLVFDQAGGLRIIQGIPGASTLSRPMPTGLSIGQAVISPRQDYALATAGDNQDLFVIRVGQDAAQVTPLGLADPAPDQISLSPNGTSAALYYAAARKVRLISGLPDAPAVAGDFDLTSLPAVLTALAASDDGNLALAAFAEETAASVFVLPAGSEPRFVSGLGNVPAMAFLGKSRDALIADDRANQVYLLRNAGGAAEWKVLAGSADGIDGPAAVAGSRDGRKAFVVNRGTIAVLDLAGGVLAAASCACTPAGLFPLNGNAVFRLVNGVSQPVWLFDGDGIEPRTVFVPAAPIERNSERRTRP